MEPRRFAITPSQPSAHARSHGFGSSSAGTRCSGARSGSFCRRARRSSSGSDITSRPSIHMPSFTTGAKTVAVYATVTNAQGRLVPDLTREDFSIDDNGKRQELTVFSNDVQPITVVMLLDRSGSMKPNFDLEERAAEAFVHAM